MNIKFLFKHFFAYMRNQEIDIRTRMMYFLEYGALFACLIGTICMVLLEQSLASMFPNIVLFVMSFVALYFSHKKKMYDVSSLIMIIGCANIALPWMFFSAGGNESGMHIWMIFGVVVTCMMSKGILRIVMSILTVVEDLVCITIGHFVPGSVTPLVGVDAAFYDQLQSFAVACVCLSIILSIYIATYEYQRKLLEAQSKELKSMMYTDALTGVFNRRAYYEEMQTFHENKLPDDLVIVAADVNGLKRVNDLLGHAVGDDYIRAAANVVSSVLGQYGHIFRTGGDEFMAILHCSVIEANLFEEKLSACIDNMENPWPEKMSLAVGTVCCRDNVGMSIDDIEKLADKRMYENKAAYYTKSGMDRRR